VRLAVYSSVSCVIEPGRAASVAEFSGDFVWEVFSVSTRRFRRAAESPKTELVLCARVRIESPKYSTIV
jgi:hypothetical protein